MTASTLLQLPDPNESPSEKKQGLVLTCIGVLLYVALRLWRLTQINFQRDEIFSLETARLGWRALLVTVTADVVHPPLFYFVLKIWLLIGGESLTWLRLLPTLIAFLALVPFFMLCRELRIPSRAQNLSLYLFAVNGYLIAYAHELRMYSLLLCLSLFASWQFVRWWNRSQMSRSDWLVFFVVHLLLVYTQYYGWLIVCVELLFVLLLRRGALRFAGFVGLLLLCYAPWLAVVVSALKSRQVGLGVQLSWHYLPGIVDVAAYYARLNGSFGFSHSITIGLLIFGGIILFGLLSVWRHAEANGARRRAVFIFLVALSLMPVVVAYVASHVLPQSVWNARYLICAAVPYLLLVALALSQLRPRWLKLTLTGIVVVWSGVAGISEIRRTDTVISWDVLVRELRENEPTTDGPVKVYALDDFPRYPMTFYLREARADRFEVVRASIADISQATDRHFWVIYSERNWPFPGSAQQFLQSQGFRIGPTLISGPPGHRYFLFAADR